MYTAHTCMKHHTRNSFLLGTITLAMTAVPAFMQEKGGEGETGPYEVVSNWPGSLDHPGWTWGSQSGVFAETPNRVFILSRGEVPEKKPVGGGATSVYPPASGGRLFMRAFGSAP